MAPERMPGKRLSLSPSSQKALRDLRQRVIGCLNKLSDRDTFQMGSSDLESTAMNLGHEAFGPFLSCIYDVDPDQKNAVKRECARILGVMAESHGENLTAFLPRMVGNIILRLKDPDSGVRSACVEAIGLMASRITQPSFSVVFLKPLFDVLAVEQDQNLQLGAALCLSQAIECSPDPEAEQLQKLVPRIVKLLSSRSFKAKPALLSVIGSVVGAGGASNQNLLAVLVPTMVEFLRSNDWAARKAAAEAFTRMALSTSETHLLSPFKPSCISSFESCRFDKVKLVREIMNTMLEAWRNVPDVSEEEVSPSSQKKLSSSSSLSKEENASDGRYPSGYRSSDTLKNVNSNRRSPTLGIGLATPIRKSSPPTSNKRSSLSPSGPTASLFRKLDHKDAAPSEWRIEIAVPRALPFNTVIHGEDVRRGQKERNGSLLAQGVECKEQQPESNGCPKLEKKCTPADKNGDKKAAHKFGGLRSASRVVPLHENESSVASTIVVSNSTEELYRNCKESDLSVICQQLVQIENQQASLLDLLQRFIGSSQNGMRCLETRVQGLEMALDEISNDLAVSVGALQSVERVGNGCCKLPKFWRKAEGSAGRYSCSTTPTTRFLTMSGSPASGLISTRCHVATDKQRGAIESARTNNMLWEKRIFSRGGGLQSTGFVVNPLAEIRRSDIPMQEAE